MKGTDMSDDLIKRLRHVGARFEGDAIFIDAAAAIEALTARAEAAEDERDDYAHNLMDANNAYSELHIALETAENERDVQKRDAVKWFDRALENKHRAEAAEKSLADVTAGKNKQIGIIAHFAGVWHASAEAAEARIAEIRRETLELAAVAADDHTPEKHTGMTLASHCTGRSIAAAIRGMIKEKTDE